jgi:hypothetical protein
MAAVFGIWNDDLKDPRVCAAVRRRQHRQEEANDQPHDLKETMTILLVGDIDASGIYAGRFPDPAGFEALRLRAGVLR